VDEDEKPESPVTVSLWVWGVIGPLILYCDTSSRSGKAIAALKKQGFTRVVNLSGGLSAWQQAGLPVEK
jgi:rhodanese-related sulfurtransferase